MEHIGQRQQRELPLLGLVGAPHLAEVAFISTATWVGACRYAVQRCGHDDHEIAEKLHISAGYMSKVLRGTAGLYGARLVAFMRVTQSLAPLQWMAEQMGCDIVLRDPARARIAQLERELDEARKVAAA